METKIKTTDLLDAGPGNLTIQDALGKCLQQVRNHDNILCAVSGGSDSDIMLDLIIRCGGKDKTTFVFFGTGLEYRATKQQIKKLEEKYGVIIVVLPPIKPIPICVKEYGIPFWSKTVSEYIYRLQRHNFQWKDEPFDVLLAKYPKCKAALRFWCNNWPPSKTGQNSKFNISYVPWLKEFMIANPPTFRISAKCCTYAKKEVAHKYQRENNFDLNCTGVRKAEKGARSNSFSTCYTQATAGPDAYRPLFWFSDADKVEYDQHYGVTHSDCYEVWGMTRTGCAGCPFGKEFEEELELSRKYEPNFYKAANKIFGQSYEYTRQYLKFREEMKKKASEGLAPNEEQATFEI